MPVTPTYPGVYIEEISSGVRTITGVSTSVAAFVGSFKRGPLNKAVQIFSFAEFEREFGGLDATSEASYAIQQFFLNGGTQSWVVRTASGNVDSSPPLVPASVNLLNGAGGSSSTTLTVKAISEGDWGNGLRIVVDYQTSDPTELFNLTIAEYAVNAPNGSSSSPIRTEVFQNLSMDSAQANFVETVVNDENSGSRLIRVDATGTVRPLRNGTISGSIGSGTPTSIPSLTASNPALKVFIGQGTLPTDTGSLPTATLARPPVRTSIAAFLADTRALLESAIRSSRPADSAYAGATVQVVGTQLQILAGPGSPSNVVRFAAAPGDEATIDALALGSAATVNVQSYRVGAERSDSSVESTIGAQGTRVRGNNGSLPNGTSLIGDRNSKSGLYALENVDLFNILCIPRAAMVSGVNALSATEANNVYAQAVRYCEERRAMFIVDTPNNVSGVDGIQTFLESLPKSRNAVTYFPRVKVADPLNNFRLRSVGASGTIAGVWARTDTQRGIWKAPAGIEASLINVQQIETQLTDAQNGVLNPLGLNCLRNFPVYGRVVWGARTLRGSDVLADEYKYVPVRRLALFLEESLFRGLKWVVFEPNDEPLWAQIRLNVGAFMNNLFRQGAFQGVTPRQAYLVKCDRETTTQNDINLGIVNVVVGFAPLKPAEFVIIKLQQLAGQIAT